MIGAVIDGAPGWLLAIDTGTSRIVVAAGRPDGSVIRVLEWPAGFRHGELLLAGVARLMSETGLSREALAGIVVGTGPGAFTGLRVGLATAKTMAHQLRVPIAGVSSGEALLRATRGVAQGEGGGQGDLILLLPAGPRDRVVVETGKAPVLLSDGLEPPAAAAATLVAVDLDGRAPGDAVLRGKAAHDGLGAALLAIGSERLRAGASDDAERLVPEYVTLPRGIRTAAGEIAWSHDLR